MTPNFLKLLIQVIFLMFVFEVTSHMLVSSMRVRDANARCMQKERRALLDLKHGLIDNYGLLSSWVTEHDCCSWSGVQCNSQTGHVERLNLHGDKLSQPRMLRGEISSSLRDLHHLNYLNLSFNDFNSSQIPVFFGSLSKLKYLDLSSASFGEKIPYQLGNLSSLRVLDLSHNNLVGVIPYQLLGNLSGLEILRLGYNDDLKIHESSLAGVDWISGHLSLVELGLSSVSNLNNSKNLLQMIGKLTNLRTLSLGNCSLTDINLLSMPPSSLNFSASLVTLDLSYNMFTSSSFSWLFNLSSNLVILDLSDNQLAGPMPNDFGKFMNTIEVLDFSDNQLSGIISDTHFENLTKLKALRLSRNPLTLKFSNNWVPPFQLRSLILVSCTVGPDFPNWLRTQKNLRNLYMSNARIADSVPEWFWARASTTYFVDMSYNKLTGTIPNLPLEFVDSITIDFNSNQLEGSLPAFLLTTRQLELADNKFSEFPSLCAYNTAVESLVSLNLSNNQLVGQLSDCWGRLKSLRLLDLSGNKFSGNIPVSMGSLLEIRRLVLRNNSLSGELTSLNNCTKLVLLDVGKNNLSGPVPSWIGNILQKLEMLSLRSNRFYGSLPLNLCHLTSLLVLDLSLNNISGKIPTCFKNFTAMARKGTFNVNSNTFPIYMNGSLVFIYYYDCYHFVMWKGKELHFKDSRQLLKTIDLSSNQMSGEIPSEIGYLVELVSLNLSRNNLTGEITPDLGKLHLLDALDLSRNYLSGTIPSSLSEISMLSVLDFSNNNLSGKIPTGTQLQSFNASVYEGNPYLCGSPLKKPCPGEETFDEPPVHQGNEGHKHENDEESFFSQGFYISLGLGFVIGFWGVFGPILFIRSWRHAYFNLLNKMVDKIYVAVALKCHQSLISFK